MYAALGNKKGLFDIWSIKAWRFYKTMITDEDHSFINAFRSGMASVNIDRADRIVANRVLCALHK